MAEYGEETGLYRPFSLDVANAYVIRYSRCDIESGWQNTRTLYVELREMSEYYQLLQGPAKERYAEKLCLVGLTESEDPYS